MYAEVNLVTEQRKDALSVPVEATDGSGTSARVYKVDANGAVRIIPVTLGIETAREIEIRSGDLKAGDSVVVGSRSGLKEGSRVRAKTIGDMGSKS
jgi:multidrug efflux pump subunit AcrA (membrane-fusion protein)